MEMNEITLILIITLIISIFISIKNSNKYLTEKYKNKQLKKSIEKEYIKKNNIILRNAINEALEQATEKHNTFEQKAYRKLLDELKGRR